MDQLNYHSAYKCPICYHGKISNLTLMDAFACNFCQHIFTANLEQQILKTVDSQMTLYWRWNGKKWERLIDKNLDLGWGYLIAGLIFVIFPTAIIGLGAYLFPPLPGSPLSWLPLVWTILTLLCHLTCLVWLILEYYQFPLNIYIRVMRQNLLATRQ